MRVTLAIAFALFATSVLAQTRATPLTDALATQRLSFRVGDDGLTGPGGAVLREAIQSASVVAIGEEHGTNEIPRFVSAVCDVFGSQLSLLALEVGPTAAEQLDGPLRAADREARMKTYGRQLPASAAFLELTADNDSAAHCLKGAPRARLAGIDQEFIGAGRMLLDQIRRTRLSPSARRALAVIDAAERVGTEKAIKSGDASTLLLLSADPAVLESTRLAIRTGGDARANTLFERLAESAAIYRLNSAGDAEANARRARLLKRSLKVARPDKGKVLVKMGAWHLYKGVNPLRQRDLGNWIAEEADGSGQPASLHIMVVTAKGQRASFGGYGRPAKSRSYDTAEARDTAWVRPALEAQAPGAWTVFDLRRLRHAKLADLSADWRRAIDGYDLLVVVPEATATRGVAD